MADIDFIQLTQYTKQFTGLTAETESMLNELSELVKPHLPGISDRFYSVLMEIPQVQPFFDGRIEMRRLRQTHIRWLEQVFSGPFDVSYAQTLYHAGKVYVKTGLPVEFMSGAMAQLTAQIHELLSDIFATDPLRLTKSISAVNTVLCFSLMIMQQSHESSRLDRELETFLKITGVSRTLFENLASAYE